MSAWKIFQDWYPNADLFRFTQKDWFGDDSNSVYLKTKDGEEVIQVFGRGKFIYGNFTKEMKNALGLPMDLPPEPTLNVNPKLPVPPISHGDKLRSLISLPLRSLSHRQILSR